MSEHRLCTYCQLINNGEPERCDNYPNKGWCPVGWRPEEDLETNSETMAIVDETGAAS